jgi:hypothetical protein
MEAERNLHTFQQFPGNVSLSYRRGYGLELTVDCGAGARPTATANPSARSSRRAGSFKVTMVTLSVVCCSLSGRPEVVTKEDHLLQRIVRL